MYIIIKIRKKKAENNFIYEIEVEYQFKNNLKKYFKLMSVLTIEIILYTLLFHGLNQESLYTEEPFISK